uniref:Uncharacterized protein n=1 Tax=Ranid herpesvirus 4 TaxID=2849006 RepID=A0A8F3HSL7_9VIRU|nr:MAG: hypothetical protein [Ranid herpesvirus 4]
MASRNLRKRVYTDSELDLLSALLLVTRCKYVRNLGLADYLVTPAHTVVGCNKMIVQNKDGSLRLYDLDTSAFATLALTDPEFWKKLSKEIKINIQEPTIYRPITANISEDSVWATTLRYYKKEVFSLWKDKNIRTKEEAEAELLEHEPTFYKPVFVTQIIRKPQQRVDIRDKNLPPRKHNKYNALETRIIYNSNVLKGVIWNKAELIAILCNAGLLKIENETVVLSHITDGTEQIEIFEQPATCLSTDQAYFLVNNKHEIMTLLYEQYTETIDNTTP